MRLIWATIVLVTLTSPIGAMPLDAAPLCRDSKGLFTPCTGERVPGARPHRHRSAATAGTTARTDSPASADTADATPPKRSHPPLVGRGKLCRDSKGLFKPC